MKNVLKTNKICYCLGGKFKTWRGEIPPLKALKKTLLMGNPCIVLKILLWTCSRESNSILVRVHNSDP